MNRHDTAQTQPIFNSGYKLFMCFKGTKVQPRDRKIKFKAYYKTNPAFV